MAESAPDQRDASTVTDSSDKEVTECPTCGRDMFKSERGMKSHHAREHGESLVEVVVSCDSCGEEFECTEDRVKRSENVYCSKDCQHDGLKGRTDGDNHNYNRVEYDCDKCGETMERKPSRVEEHEFLYCSRDCMYSHDGRGNLIGDKNSKKHINVCCEICGCDFSVKPYRENSARFCSPECRHKHMGQVTGEEHPLYIEDKENDYGENWKQIAEQIREKYDRKCWSCGIAESELFRRLDVHHIKPRRKFDNVDKANTEDNLIPLCPACHQKWESLPIRPQVSE